MTQIHVTIIRSIIVLTAAFGLNAMADDVAYNKDFKVVSSPEVWSEGLPLCFAVDGTKKECAKVTSMGEIQLKFDGKTSDEIAKTYIPNLTKEAQSFLSKHSKFVVRYLSLDGDVAGRYIIQVLFNDAIGGSQAIYTYGNYSAVDGKLALLKPQGYGEAGNHNFSMVRTKYSDQRAIEIANTVIMIWSNYVKPASIAPKL